jgi:ERCC4-type nuclease
MDAPIEDSRPFGQALRLATAPSSGPICLDGRARDPAESRMSRASIRGAPIGLGVFLGIPLPCPLGPEETASPIPTAARQSRAHASGALPRPAARGKPSTQRRILQGLPRVGPERARRLIERLDSVDLALSPADSRMA